MHTPATPPYMHKIELVAIPTEKWVVEDFGRSVWRVRVPGGWLYIVGGGKDWALPPVFVPRPKRRRKP